MSETLHQPELPDEQLWGPIPTEEEVTRSEKEIAERAKRWEDNPPKRPANYQPHPDGPYVQNL